MRARRHTRAHTHRQTDTHSLTHIHTDTLTHTHTHITIPPCSYRSFVRDSQTSLPIPSGIGLHPASVGIPRENCLMQSDVHSSWLRPSTHAHTVNVGSHPLFHKNLQLRVLGCDPQLDKASTRITHSISCSPQPLTPCTERRGCAVSADARAQAPDGSGAWWLGEGDRE